MKHLSLVVLFTLLLLTPGAFAGDLLIFCEPDLRIYVDGEFQGISSAHSAILDLVGARCVACA